MKVHLISKYLLEGSFLTGTIGGGMEIVDYKNSLVQEKIEEITSNKESASKNIKAFKNKIEAYDNEIKALNQVISHHTAKTQSIDELDEMIKTQIGFLNTHKANADSAQRSLDQVKSKLDVLKDLKEKVKKCLEEWKENNDDANKKTECKNIVKDYKTVGR